MSRDMLIELLPEEIMVDESVNVRPYTTRGDDTPDEVEKITKLANTIQSQGQLQPIVVRAKMVAASLESDVEPEYHLVFGNRRRKAVQLLNALSETPMKLKCLVKYDMTDAQAKRSAAIENIHRKDTSAMDFCLLIGQVREENKWQGGKNTKKVAEYFEVSPATITQHEKLATLDPETQKKISDGVISAAGAFVLSEVEPEKRAEVVEQAEAIQADEKAKKSKGKKLDTTTEPTKLKASSIKKAVKKTGAGDPDKIKSRSKSDFLDFFNSYLGANGSEFGYADGPVQLFIAYLVGPYASGKGTDETLHRKFMAVIEKTPKGTKPVAEPKAAVSKDHKGKSGKTVKTSTTAAATVSA